MLIIFPAVDYITLYLYSYFTLSGGLLSRGEMYEFGKTYLWKMTRLLHVFEISQEYAWYTLTRYEADERGELSPELKRGVLSRDTLIELLEG